uniref:Uncharacterized protein n=1 Tax=Solanum lycopersicum TaxID=4081 RepID=A0A3Q7I4I2_SOLLC
MYTKTEVLFASQRPAIVQLDGAEVIFMSAVQCLGLLILITELVSCIFAMDFRMERELLQTTTTQPYVLVGWMLISHIQPETTINTFIKLATTI